MQLTAPTRPFRACTAPTPLSGRAVQLEAVFLSEMLAHAGLDQGLNPGSAEAGPDPFASFLRERTGRPGRAVGWKSVFSEAIFRSLRGGGWQ